MGVHAGKVFDWLLRYVFHFCVFLVLADSKHGKGVEALGGICLELNGGNTFFVVVDIFGSPLVS